MAAAARSNLMEDGKQTHCTVQVVERPRDVLVDGWIGSVLDLNPPDPDARPGQ
ncbi:hypothetical protein [Microvirga sp. M2]|uniref:hypothetical protein n=1 Tax=Microvirga sp. M2 TaxID=3073270 RepID=UPI0039C42416